MSDFLVFRRLGAFRGFVDPGHWEYNPQSLSIVELKEYFRSIDLHEIYFQKFPINSISSRPINFQSISWSFTKLLKERSWSARNLHEICTKSAPCASRASHPIRGSSQQMLQLRSWRLGNCQTEPHRNSQPRHNNLVTYITYTTWQYKIYKHRETSWNIMRQDVQRCTYGGHKIKVFNSKVHSKLSQTLYKLCIVVDSTALQILRMTYAAEYTW